MKKIFTLALASLMLFSCSKEEIWTAQETGQMTINVEQGPQIEVTTKATTVPDDYIVYITKDGSAVPNYAPTTYSVVKGKDLTFSTGSYKVEAYNITAAEAAPTDGNGNVRYYGFQDVTVSANSKTSVSFICTMANSKVTFVFADSFWSAFTKSDDTNTTYVTASSSTETETGRTISFKDASAHASATPAFFTVGTLNYTIKATRTSDGVVKTFDKSLALEAGKWHQFTISASDKSGQLGDWNIQVDETITDATHEVEINPYE